MILSVQYLRAIAALFVVFFHTRITPKFASGLEGATAEFGGVGVDIFFVISGFIMWQISVSKHLSPLQFFKKRLTRIVPMYWIATLCMFPMPAISRTIAAGNPIDVKQLIASLLFVPWPSSVFPGQFDAVYRPGWTLNYEMFFYLIFSLALLLNDPRKILIATICFFSAIVGLGVTLHMGGILGVYASPITLEFVYGILIGWSLTSRMVLPIFAAVLAILIGTILLICFPNDLATSLPRFLVWGLPSALIILGSVSLESRLGVWDRPLPRLLGDASYSIYLTHLFSIGAVFVLWGKLGFVDAYENWNADAFAFTVAAFLFSIFVGVLSYLFLEKPLLRFLHS
jgi:exopolysaccharide production protein ExoZ